jgi:alkanesulfonate monooxygenase SsuD/methylene tetrahydromethanopterin reductase-like flavin-dependent oxidoreductase (luciferase family)
MTMPRRFQVELLPDVAWRELRRRVLHAEQLGFDLATTSDQFVDWKNPTVPWFDCWTSLSALAEATDRIRLAPCVAQIPMRDPATFARQALTVDHVSGGRVEAGLGLGLTVDPGYGMIGSPNWDNPERADRFGEYVHIVDELFSTGSCTFHGEFYDVEGANVHPTLQEPRIPITVAAMGPRMMRYAAEHADTWNTMSFGSGSTDLLSDATSLLAKMTAACETVGRDPATLRFSFLLFDGGARESGGRLFYWDSVTAFEDLAGHVFDLGFDELGVYYPIDDQREVMERACAEVIPGLRKDGA